MTGDLGLNLAGVERVLALESQLETLNARIDELELAALHAEVKLAEEIELVRRSFRAELVPYRAGEIVRAAEARSPFANGRNGRNGRNDQSRRDTPRGRDERSPDGS
jgi:hypothetical protein